jgi:CheY-like chemotaxis protein
MRVKHVLIVDDDPAVALVLVRMFTKSGFGATHAANGLVALEALSSKHFDAMICDINMPKMTGRELCRHLHDQGPYLPSCVFVVTSLTQLEERDWLKEIPTIELVEKPVSPRELVRRVQERLIENEPGRSKAA